RSSYCPIELNLNLTISIDFERTLALRLPITYRKLSSSSYAMCSLLIGCMLAILDLVIEYVLTPVKRKYNCGALGCFTSDTFRLYWGGSNMAMGIIVIISTALVVAKLRSMKKSSENSQSVGREASLRSWVKSSAYQS
ncbi:hypothetical protein OSTOST_24507, partial [Ostertagia ostertagi]